MPMLIEYIDAIARQKGRDVLYLDFHRQKGKDPFDVFNVNWSKLPIRKKIIAWLDKNNIKWEACGFIADEQSMIGGYFGRIYIDVPFDTNDPIYQKLSNYLETPDGKIKFAGVNFCYLPLEIAMKNAHHDEPGFWDRWVETF